MIWYPRGGGAGGDGGGGLDDSRDPRHTGTPTDSSMNYP
jgi:hypothetical protein